MSEQENVHQRTPDSADVPDSPEAPPSGTAAGTPVAGAEIDEKRAEEAVEPDDDAFEVDGPQAGHA